jgi:UDP-hydrolysing UDP-N-acetyl-D-glucosamine 2-epimerase
MKRKVCVVVTARPSYSRIKSALAAIQRHPGLELQLVAAGSALLDRYGSAVGIMEADGFPITARIYMVLEGENLVTSAKSTGIALSELAGAFDNLDPDVVVTIADRYETLATAIAASYTNRPLVHIQGGEASGSIDDRVRHAVSKLANLHLVATHKAAARLVRMGEDAATVHVTGCPSIDLAAAVLDRDDLGFDPHAKYIGVGTPLDISRGYLVVLQHPVTTEYELARRQVHETLQAVRDVGRPALWFWPNVDAGSDGTSKGIRAFRENEKPESIHFFKNMTPEDFLRLVRKSVCVVGNSSVGIRECSFLGVPVVNIGSRQRGRERGRNVLDVGHDREEIVGAIRRQIEHGPYPADHLYGEGDAGERIAEILHRADLTHDKQFTY